MAQVIPGSNYTVQEGDTLPLIAQKVYGDSNQWHEIYIANARILNNNSNTSLLERRFFFRMFRKQR